MYSTFCVQSIVTNCSKSRLYASPQVNAPAQKQVAIIETDINQRPRKFILNKSHNAQVVIEDQVRVADRNDQSYFNLQKGIKNVQSLFLPTGYPDSITPDYVDYQLWTLPAHITGWQSMALATSSLLKAVGAGSASPVMVTAAGAAIKWISKDGIGATGRLIVGGRLSSVFDKDPKLWRMLAEFSTSIGMTLEILTAILPEYFLLLAGVGNLAKAVGRGMGQPSFRVIQTHFAAKVTSVGDVAAKEEVWEVVGQLLGLLFSIATLELLEKSPSFETLFATWVASRGFHVWLRYNALQKLQLSTINHKRACLLATRYVDDLRTPEFLGIKVINQSENILAIDSQCRPRIIFGANLEFALQKGGLSTAQQVKEFLELFQNQEFLLIQTEEMSYVVLKETYDSRNILKSVLLSAILQKKGITGNTDQRFERSLQQIDEDFQNFVLVLNVNGWDTSQFLFQNSGRVVIIQ
eukprot:TRINITY_DN3107_c0_g1_i1.p1 TRINITY_DN3107_c0_g1~~TRINITY_DN3107_c0_g1_i1.p1  ORF type:complete len:517 (-),score=38.22 TRINITY_DN3107_c0_g1_i1:1007-2404(-)